MMKHGRSRLLTNDQGSLVGKLFIHTNRIGHCLKEKCCITRHFTACWVTLSKTLPSEKAKKQVSYWTMSKLLKVFILKYANGYFSLSFSLSVACTQEKDF